MSDYAKSRLWLVLWAILCCLHVKALKAAFGNNLDPVSNSKLSRSKTKRLCFINGEKVHHPLFATIKRYGWAKMKTGEAELAIEITRNKLTYLE